MQIDYSKITLEQCYNCSNMICDGDKQQVLLENDIVKTISQTMETLEKAIEPISKAIFRAFNEFAEVIKKIKQPKLYSKITKKRFIKLLQSEGMQRNEINKIISNNKEPYTYKRYLEVISRR